MSQRKRKTYSKEFKQEAVQLITDKGYSIAEASRKSVDWSNKTPAFYVLAYFAQ